jgi:pimeloyl-ACP methyl ester carboxylesterase
MKLGFYCGKRLLLWVMMLCPFITSAVESQEHVVLLHGLCRTSRSMARMEAALKKAGFRVLNVDYASRSALVEQLSEQVVGQAVADCQRHGAKKIHFVTHSLGGILVRSYLARHTVENLGRTVMLGPPNQGSEVVDRLGAWWVFRKINGPAGGELGTDAGSVPRKLGPANFCLGVIAGSLSINWINSLLIPGRDDGKVSVEHAKLEGMADFVIIPTAHPFLMKNRVAIRQTLAFLRNGKFSVATGRGGQRDQ